MFARLLLGGILGMALVTFSSGANAVNGTDPLVSGADRNGGLLIRDQPDGDDRNDHDPGCEKHHHCHHHHHHDHDHDPASDD